MFQLDNATVTIYAVANAWHKLRQFNALQVKQMLARRSARERMQMNKLFSNILEIISEIKELNLGNCGPSDDPDKQYAYAATFRDLLVRFVSALKRLNDPVLNDLLINVNENFETGYISEAHYQRSRIEPIFDYIEEIKDDKNYFLEVINYTNFVEIEVLESIIKVKSAKHDLTKLIKFIEELNFNYKYGNYLSAILILRAILNHIPPIFGFKSFSEYVSQTGRSTKSILQRLEDEARPIADLHSHIMIKKRENLPTKNQIEPYKSSIEVLLHEIISKIEEDG